jgi:Xaa-Pro aminopeptidase
LTDEVFTEVADSIREGDTEAEIGWRIERLSREKGGGIRFHPIVASGPNAARPHHAVTERRIAAGEPVIIDMGVSWQGFSGDLTRTVWLGDAPARLREIHDLIYHVLTAAIDQIAAGVRARDVDERARAIITAAGYGDFIVHSLGHGLGLRVHESPSLSIHSDDVLQPGNVVTVEPGVYLPGWGGVRIEDVVVVTEDGCRDLTAARIEGALQGS